MISGYKGDLTKENVPPLRTGLSAKESYEIFRQHWRYTKPAKEYVYKVDDEKLLTKEHTVSESEGHGK